MRLHAALSAATFAAALSAQSVPVTDVGLTMDGGILTVIYGQGCGPFDCTPRIAGAVAPGQPRVLTVHGAPNTPWALAIDLPNPAPCIAFPGIGNSLILGLPPVTLAVGITGPAQPTTACVQGRGPFTLVVPVGAPSGMPFQLQGIAMSHAQNVPAFTIAIESRIQ